MFRRFARIAFLLLAVIAHPLAGEVRAADVITARSIFALLPESIFENTPEGLGPADKQQLLNEGRSEFWEIAGETEDTMVFASLPLLDTAVALRLFRNSSDGSVEAALGTLGGPICTLELWRVDANGRAVLSDTPEEPDVNDFFAKGHKMPPDVQATVMICLGLGGLKAEPQFWTRTGMAHVPLDNDVTYYWTGRQFEKLVRPHTE
ncbi:MAG: hypothetical protein IJU65_01010 [Desulfovibrio sp.]|nr:hypothetical protein [Desulfovibrio sp.]